MTFLSKDGNEIAAYNPRNLERNGPIYDIADNEDLIGVYGVKDKRNFFSSFGFIVKVMPK